MNNQENEELVSRLERKKIYYQLKNMQLKLEITKQLEIIQELDAEINCEEE